MSYVFGKDIVRRFLPLENGVPVALFSQSPTIYVFSAKPNRTDAAAGTGAVQTVSTWNQLSARPYTCIYTISAISDPAPTSEVYEYEYWEAINYVLKSGGQTQTLLRSFILERHIGTDENAEVRPHDLKTIYPSISAYLDDDELEEFCRTAIDEARIEFKAKGMNWGQMWGLDDVRLAIAYKTISLAALSQIRDRQDKHELRYNLFNAKYAQILKSVSVPYDRDRDGKPEEKAPANSGSITVIR